MLRADGDVFRRTADRQPDAVLKAVAAAMLKNAQSLQARNWSRVMPMMPNQRIDLGKMATVTSWMADDARPVSISQAERERAKAA